MPDQPNDEDRRKIVETYFRRLFGFVKKTLKDPRLRAKLDPEDVVDSVFKSFLKVYGQKFSLDDGSIDLWPLLATIAWRKCGRKALKADREVQQSDGDAVYVWDPPSGDPSPEEAAYSAELIERIRARLKGQEVDIFDERLAGFTVLEISEKVGCSEATVERRLRRVKELIKELLPDVDFGDS